jgi:hypothetical protein
VIHLEGKLQILDPYSPDPKATSWIIERITGDTFRITSAPHFAPIGELLIFKRDSTGKIVGFNEGEAAKWSEKME